MLCTAPSLVGCAMACALPHMLHSPSLSGPSPQAGGTSEERTVSSSAPVNRIQRRRTQFKLVLDSPPHFTVPRARPHLAARRHLSRWPAKPSAPRTTSPSPSASPAVSKIPRDLQAPWSAVTLAAATTRTKATNCHDSVAMARNRMLCLAAIVAAASATDLGIHPAGSVASHLLPESPAHAEARAAVRVAAHARSFWNQWKLTGIRIKDMARG